MKKKKSIKKKAAKISGSKAKIKKKNSRFDDLLDQLFASVEHTESVGVFALYTTGTTTTPSSTTGVCIKLCMAAC